MATLPLAPTQLRLHRLATIFVTASLIALATGCNHRRSSMRPVYPGPGLPASVGSSTVITEEPISSSPSTIIEKEESDQQILPANPPTTRDSNVRPSRGASPPAADAIDEPDFVPPKAKTGTERVPKANIKGPELIAPSASRATGLRASAKTRQVSLREKVRPFVNDADDLFQPPKADRSWKYVVVHHSANASGSYDQIDREHRKIQGWDGCGYHFVIGNGSDSPDGQIEVARRWSNQKHGLHCRNGKNPDVNEYGIGICIVGNLDEAPPTAKQITSARALVAYLSDRYEIPTDAVGTHADLAGTPTACPGKYFPEEQIFGSKHLAAK